MMRCGISYKRTDNNIMTFSTKNDSFDFITYMDLLTKKLLSLKYPGENIDNFPTNYLISSVKLNTLILKLENIKMEIIIYRYDNCPNSTLFTSPKKEIIPLALFTYTSMNF